MQCNVDTAQGVYRPTFLCEFASSLLELNFRQLEVGSQNSDQTVKLGSAGRI